MVLSAKIVAQSFTVDWLSKAPWVSINTTATYRRRGGSTGHTRGACRTNQMALTCSMMFCYHQLVCFQYMHSINFFYLQRYLLSITLFNREHFAPQLDACCLRFRTTSPGKSFQRLIIPAEPIFITL